MVLGHVDQGVLDHEPHDLASDDWNAVAFRLVTDQREHALHRRAPGVHEVHRDLHDAPLPELEAERFDVAKSARLIADRFRDLLRDLDVLGAQIHVEREQRHAGADRDGARAGMDPRRAEIGSPVGVRSQLARQPFELPAPHVGKVLPRGACRRGFIQIDRDLELRGDPRTRGARKLHASLEPGRSDRNEGQDVCGSHPGMFTSMPAQIDQLGRLTDAPERRLHHGFSLPYERDDAPVVVGVHLLAQQPDRPIARNFGNDCPNYR